MRVSQFGMAMPFLLLAGLASAQERRVPGDETRPPATTAESRPAATNAQASSADQEIAAVKLAMCRNELELAKLASQKAQSDEVKQFAATLVKEHTEGCAKLEKWAGSAGNSGAGRDPRAAAGARGDARIRPAAPEATERTAQPAVRPGAAPGTAAPGTPAGVRPGADLARQRGSNQDLDWVSIHQEIAEQCLASTKQELEKKEGADFDKCYVLMAITSHQHAVDADHVFMNHGSPAFRGEVEECLKTSTSHLNEAKDILKKLEAKSGQQSN